MKNEQLFKYPNDELPVISLRKDYDNNVYYIDYDSAVAFENETATKEFIRNSLYAFAQWMVNNGHDASYRMKYMEVFSEGIMWNKKYESIEAAYAAYRTIAIGYISGLKNATEGKIYTGELLDQVNMGYDPKAKVWVAKGQAPIEFVLEHENIITLAERVMRIIPEIKEINAESIQNGPDSLEKWISCSDLAEGYGLFTKATWRSEELLPILKKFV